MQPAAKIRFENILEQLTRKKLFVSLILFGLAIASVGFLPALPRSAHAQFTGIVCLSAVTTSCPSSVPTFSGSVGNQITVNVVIQGSDSFNSFDISIQADPAVISPLGLSTAGNVFSGHGTIVLANSTNASTGVVRLAEAAMGFITSSPTTGLLFSIRYNIVGTTTGTPISYPTGCSGSSVTGTTTCVSVVNPNTPGGVVPETAQGATFVTTAGFTITASASSLSLHRGSSGSISITITGTGGFSGTVSLSAAVFPIVRHDVSAALNPSIVVLSASNIVGTSSLTISALHSTPAGAYTVTVNGSSGSESHSVTIQVTVS